MAEMMYKTGVIYSLEPAFKMLMAYRVVFFGEQHDAPEAHRAELELLTGLAGRDPKIVLALEMFERDVQKSLNDYLGGSIFRGGVPETITSLAELRGRLPAPDRILMKDAVMAASLDPYLDRRILFCCGHFHSDYHQGIPRQLKKNQPRRS